MLETYTIDELINEYYDVAKKYFELNNIKISKTGVIGFLLYVLGHIKKDSEFLYNYLFKELSPVTADEYTSLLLHGSLYGFQPDFAKPATLKGKLKIVVPKWSSNLTNREIILPNGTKFVVGDLIWTLDAYTVIRQQGNYAYVLYNDGTKIENIYAYVYDNPVDNTTQIIEFELLYTRQYEFNTITFTMPYYDYGVYYKYALELDEGSYLSDIKIYVKFPESEDYELFDISFVKFGFYENDKVVFISQVSENKYIIEFGNGINGIYIPQNSEIKIEYKVTQGKKGNIYNGQIVLTDSITRIDYYNTGKVESSLIDTSLVTGEITDAIDDGENVKSVEELRKDILNFIKTRSVLVKLDDYKSLFGDLYGYKFVFKKINLIDNDVYIYGILTDSYLNLPLYTTNLTLPISYFNENEIIYKPIYTYTKKNIIGVPFEKDVYVTSNVENSNIIPVNDTSVFSVNMQVIFNNDSSNVYTITLIDSENSTIQIDKNITLQSGTLIQRAEYETIDLISPFLYIKDDVLNLYKGYIVEEKEYSLQVKNIIDTTQTIPNFKFQVILSNDAKTVTFKIIEIDDLTDYTFVLNIPSLKILNVHLNASNEFSYEYTIEDINLLIDKFDVYIDVYDISFNKIAEFMLENFQFIYDISDSLTIKRYVDNINSTTYLVQIPFISKEQFEENKEDIFDKLKSALLNSEISENRLPTVSHNFRFFNTIDMTDISSLSEFEKDQDYLNFPLKLNLMLYISKDYIVKNNANIDDLIDQLKMDLAKFLLENFTGSDISFYKSKIIDFIHNYPFVTYAEIITPDTNIVSKDTYEFLREKASDKMFLVSYTPSYYWWDINNIEINYQLV